MSWSVYRSLWWASCSGRWLTASRAHSELCRAWQITSAALQRVSHPRPVQMLVELRVEYLDELERRDPQGFTRWLAEAPAVTDPTPFFPATAAR